jgi:catechol-2,3-dioxygenase
MNTMIAALPDLALSHFEIFVNDPLRMSEFYTRQLGFAVTDRGEGRGGMIFLSRNPQEHHQLVLNPRPAAHRRESPLDHIAFRVASLAQLRRYHDSLRNGSVALQTVSHGNTWSIYFRDPEDNRLELFTDTPWHVDQPCRFEVDFGLDDAALAEFTHRQVSGMPGFREVQAWQSSHARSMASGTGD